MNRAERRKLEQRGCSKSAIMKKYCDELYDKGFEDGMRHVEEVVFYMTAYTIQYKLGFGNKRLCRIMGDIFNNIDAFRTGHLSKSDFATIKEQMNKLGVCLK